MGKLRHRQGRDLPSVTESPWSPLTPTHTSSSQLQGPVQPEQRRGAGVCVFDPRALQTAPAPPPHTHSPGLGATQLVGVRRAPPSGGTWHGSPVARRREGSKPQTSAGKAGTGPPLAQGPGLALSGGAVQGSSHRAVPWAETLPDGFQQAGAERRSQVPLPCMAGASPRSPARGRDGLAHPQPPWTSVPTA